MVLTLSILIAQAVTLQTSALQNTPAMKPATLAYFLLVKTTLTASWDRVTPSTGSITPLALFAFTESASQGVRATRAVRLDTPVTRTVTNVRQFLGKGCWARLTFGPQCLVQSAARRVFQRSFWLRRMLCTRTASPATRLFLTMLTLSTMGEALVVGPPLMGHSMDLTVKRRFP